MKVLFINETCGKGSHGKICLEMAEKMGEEGAICKIAYGRDFSIPSKAEPYAVPIGNRISLYTHVFLTRVFDAHGLGSILATRRFLKWADEFNPDLLWLHNIHGYYINYPLLFEWIKKRPNMQVKWTLHDCWAFTGHCSHYMMAGCSKWKDGCKACPEKKSYPASFWVDQSSVNFRKKKSSFMGVMKMELITPSKWLEEQVKESFLKEYPISTLNNKINTSVFCIENARDNIENVRSKYKIGKKKIILGVASVWTERKGWSDFFALAKELGEEYQVVLVGVTEIQKRLADAEGILGIPRTDNQNELAGLYAAADYFVTLSYEENYPTVNLEAEACGTDVLAYDAGGTRETLARKGSGVIPVGQWKMVVEIIRKVGTRSDFVV